MTNTNIAVARKNKKDEFYTQLSDIENELVHYSKHFKDKIVLCNCDDQSSNFFKYFYDNFNKLGLKRLIISCYKNKQTDLFGNNTERSTSSTYDGIDIETKYFNIDGDFRSKECMEILKKADIIVSNPPFSLFTEYVKQLIQYEKKFVIIGHQNAIGYREIFKLIYQNKIWLGYGFKGNVAHFVTSYKDEAVAVDHKEGMVRVSGVNWFTNLDIEKRHKNLVLTKKYTPEEYHKFDSYLAINVDRTLDTPTGYKGKIAVPITFLNHYNPEQFEIIDAIGRYSILDGMTEKTKGKYLTEINGKRVFVRIIIKHRL